MEDDARTDRQEAYILSSDRLQREELKSSKKRKYDESYLSFGFIPIGSAEHPDGQCVICNKILLNSSLAPAKLKRHLETNHPLLQGKPISFFKNHKEAQETSVSCLQKYAKSDQENATEASFMLSYRIARAGKSHTIAEDLLKPCIKEIVGCMLGQEAAKKVSSVQCSNNTISNRIHKISDYIEEELIQRLKKCHAFSIQLDESTDVAGLAILLVIVRYTFDQSIEEDFFLCTPLQGNATGEEIFNIIDCYMRKQGLDWDKCVDVCSDGAAAMVGKVKGTVSRIKNVAPNCSSSHCILHRHALVAKKIPSDLKDVLNEAVKIINFVKSRPLQSRLFAQICDDMRSQHQSLLMHTEVRWLSRGKVLARLFELRDELLVFFTGENHSALSKYAECLSNEKWLMQCAYLVDIFGKLNEVTTSLQRKDATIFTVRDKISSLKTRLNFWRECVNEKNFQCFPLLALFLNENDLEIEADVHKSICEHLISLSISLSEYFPDTNNDIEWVQNPFVNQGKPPILSVAEYEDLIAIRCTSALKIKFESMPLNNFWVGLLDVYPSVADKAIRALLPFVSTYLCESGFSAYAYTKNKFRSRLNAAPDLRIQLSDIKPNFKTLLSATMRQFHSSH